MRGCSVRHLSSSPTSQLTHGEALHPIFYLVPLSSGGINIALNSVPAADNYLLHFDSTHSIMCATPQAFSIIDTGSSNLFARILQASYIGGGPNPTYRYAATIGPSSDIVRTWRLNTAAVLSGRFVRRRGRVTGTYSPTPTWVVMS